MIITCASNFVAYNVEQGKDPVQLQFKDAVFFLQRNGMNTYLGKLNVIKYDVYNKYRYSGNSALAGCDIALAVVETVDKTFKNNDLDRIPSDF